MAGRAKHPGPAGHPMTAAADKPPASEPRLVFFHVSGRRDLAQRAAAAAPGVRFAFRRSWTDDPGEPRRPLLGGDPPVGLWHWKGSADEFAAQAGDVLLRFVHPLVARGAPFCLGFPFGPEELAPRSLGVGEASRLDLEDIGRLLGAAVGPAEPLRPADPRAPRSQRARRRPGVRPTVPDAVRLDDAQRAAVEHERGAARVLAPAGSGKTKTLVSRVVELVDRGADPSGILMLAFNRKAAEQLEERLAALGIATTRRLGSPHGARPGGAADRRPGRRRKSREAPMPPSGRRACTARRSTPSATAISARCCGRASRSTTTAARCARSCRARWRPPASPCASSSRAAAAIRSAPS